MSVHRLSPADRERRDKRIEYLVSIGSSRWDIGRAYGISPLTVTSIIYRRRKAGKLKHEPHGGCWQDLTRAESVGGIM